MAELGTRGRDYVLANYTWPRVLDAMESELALLTSPAARRGVPPGAGEGGEATGAAPDAGGRGGRLLVAGTFGFPSVSANGALAHHVAALSSTGEPLEVVSSDPRAVAHRFASLHGIRGALALARLSLGSERVVVAVGSGAVVAPGDSGLRRDLSLRGRR